jgi:DNA-binding transcriptional MerR regulator
MEKIKCPVCLGGKNKHRCLACNGEGLLNPPKPSNRIYDTDGERQSTAKVLRDYGYTLREIAAILGYKHPQSIQSLLNKK